MTVWVCGINGSGVRSVAVALSALTFADSTARASIEPIIVRSSTAPEELPDLCILVASAEQGISPDVLPTWHRCAEEFIPRICVWTHIDTGRTDDDEMRLIAERMLEEDVFALSLPVSGDDEELVGVLDLPGQHVHVVGDPLPRSPDVEHVSLSADARDQLIEAAAATIGDDNTISQLALGLTPDAKRAWELVSAAVASGQLSVAIPTRPVNDQVGMGVLEELIGRLAALAHIDSGDI